MNWYKNIIIFSSHNLKFPEEIYEDINDISEECEKYYLLGGEEKRKYVGTVSFQNPYSNMKESINVILSPDTNKGIGIYNSFFKTITIFPNSINIEDLRGDSLKQYFNKYIVHEFSHAIDPKYKLMKYIMNTDEGYYDKVEEFDAYSKQIEYDIKSKLENNNITEQEWNEFENWLRYGGNVPSILMEYEQKINYWKKKQAQFFKRLLLRLYNIFKDRSNYVN